MLFIMQHVMADSVQTLIKQEGGSKTGFVSGFV